MTAEIADALARVRAPGGVAVVIEATHACMMMRSVHSSGVSMVTSRMLGVFRTSRKRLLQATGRRATRLAAAADAC